MAQQGPRLPCAISWGLQGVQPAPIAEQRPSVDGARRPSSPLADFTLLLLQAPLRPWASPWLKLPRHMAGQNHGEQLTRRDWPHEYIYFAQESSPHCENKPAGQQRPTKVSIIVASSTTGTPSGRHQNWRVEVRRVLSRGCGARSALYPGSILLGVRSATHRASFERTEAMRHNGSPCLQDDDHSVRPTLTLRGP